MEQQLLPNTGNNILKTFCQFNFQLQIPDKLYCLFTQIPLCKAIACARIFFLSQKTKLGLQKALARFFPTALPTSFPGSLILPPAPSAPRGGKIRHPGNEVAALLARFVFFSSSFCCAGSFFTGNCPTLLPRGQKSNGSSRKDILVRLSCVLADLSPHQL